MKAAQILNQYIKFFEEHGHVRIPNYSLVPENDPSTLFTSSGMQPLVPYLLGEKHPQGVRLVDVQNCFRAVDIEEVGDNRHTTFFRMLGNWSLGDYFKSEQIPFLFEFLTKRLNLPPDKLYVTIFEGYKDIPEDTEAQEIWKGLFESAGVSSEDRIFKYGVEKNWWSRSGTPDKMPVGEPGGPDTEVFYDFGVELKIHENSQFSNEKCHVNCDCGRFLEIANSVFMQYKKVSNGPEGSSRSPSGSIRTRLTERSDGVNFEELPQKNVDFGGGLERMLMATENKEDVFKTSLLSPIISEIEQLTEKDYASNQKQMRIVTDHLVSGIFIASNNIRPSNKEQGYILRRLLRRAFDNFYELGGSDPPVGEAGISSIIHKIVEQYKETDEVLVDQFETIKNVIFEEEQKYKTVRIEANKMLSKVKTQQVGDELMGSKEISADDAFKAYTSYGLSPSQIKSLGYSFDTQRFAEKMEEHQKLSRSGASQKFAGGLADHQELTIKGHTATHLLQQALRDVLGDRVHQTGSNITTERLRFDFNYDKKLTDEEIEKVEGIVLSKISENLPVHFEMMPVARAKEIGAIGLFDDKYEKDVKVYFIGDYSKEFCGGPHVDFTGAIKSFRIIKEEGLGQTMRRIYAVVS